MERLHLNNLKFIKRHQQDMFRIEKEVVDFFKMPKKTIVQVIFLSVLEVAFVLGACWLIVFFMGQRLEIFKLFAIKSIMDISYVVPFPAALGTLELAQAFTFQVLGFSLAVGVAFSLILRGLSLIIAFFGLFILGYLQIRFFGKQIVNFFSRFLPKEM